MNSHAYLTVVSSSVCDNSCICFGFVCAYMHVCVGVFISIGPFSPIIRVRVIACDCG